MGPAAAHTPIWPCPPAPAVGEALRALRAGGAVEREQLFVSTKAGFPRAGLLERVLQGGGITAADVAGGSHCMHPAYLQASLDGSLGEPTTRSASALTRLLSQQRRRCALSHARAAAPLASSPSPPCARRTSLSIPFFCRGPGPGGRRPAVPTQPRREPAAGCGAQGVHAGRPAACHGRET